MLTLDDLVANGSVTSEGAELLRSIGTSGRSFLVYSPPRNAGKSTLTNAILGAAPDSVPRTDFYGTPEEVASLTAAATRGYLVVGEIGHRGRPGYLAGDEAARAFELVAAGYSLASSLHADSVAEVFDVLARNGIDTATAACVRYLIKIRPLGDPDQPSTPRVVEHIHEIVLTGAGAPSATLKYQWAGEVRNT